MKKRLVHCVLGVLSFLVLSAFSCSSSPSSGFKVHIEEIISDEFGVTPLGGIGGIGVAANWEGDLPNRTIIGSLTSFSGTTNNGGDVAIVNARVPAVWEITWIDQNHCDNEGVIGDRNDVEDGDTIAYFCVAFTTPFFSATPNLIDSTNLTAMTLQSPQSNIDATYGTPLVDFRDMGGNLLGTVTVSWVSGDGTQLGVYPSPVGGVYDGSYSALTRVYNSDGSTRYAGATRFDTTGNPRPDPPPPPPDGGGCGGTGGVANTCN